MEINSPINQKSFPLFGFSDKNNKYYNIQFVGNRIGSINTYSYTYKPLIDPLDRNVNIKGYKMKNSDTIFVSEYSYDHKWNNTSKKWTEITPEELQSNNYYYVKLTKKLSESDTLEVYEAENKTTPSKFSAICKVVFDKSVLPSYAFPGENLEGKEIFIACEYLDSREVYPGENAEDILINEAVVYEFEPTSGTIEKVTINKNLLGNKKPVDLVGKNLCVYGYIQDMYFKELTAEGFIETSK